MAHRDVLDLARNVRITEWCFYVAMAMRNPGDDLSPLGNCPYCGAIYDDGWTYDSENKNVVAYCEKGHDRVIELTDDQIERIEKLFEEKASGECAWHAVTGE